MSKSITMRIPLDKMERVEAFLGRKLAVNQMPTVMIRVSSNLAPVIKNILKT
jgi:hypothetical protein